MKAIFIVLFLIPAVGCFDLLTYSIKMKECFLNSILGAEKLCETSTDQDCLFLRGMTLGKQCLKPAFAKFLSSFAEPFRLSKHIEESLLCAMDQVMDRIRICFPPTYENISEDKEVGDVLVCTFELFPAALRECCNLQHNHITSEL